MGMVAISPEIASAFFVFYGGHGEVTLHAREQQISRQRVMALKDGGHITERQLPKEGPRCRGR